MVISGPTFFTFSFSPISGETGAVGGLFHPVNELTQQTLAQRRLKILRVLADRTSVMDLGIITGALAASAAGGVFVLHRRIPARTALAATVGGLLMGYGARLANGCNIGAYFSGVASFSLAGWAWGALAMVGTVAGVYLRPVFGLTNPKPSDAVC